MKLSPNVVMVVLGTTIHEFACDNLFLEKLVDGRTKSDHDGLFESTSGNHA